MDRNTLQKIIDEANFNALLGQVENEWFDCKGEPYRLKNDSAKRELAKDVVAFANADGGFIFIGVKTKKSDQHFGDEIKSMRPFKRSLVDTTQISNIISTWIYPEIENLSVKWMEVVAQSGKGIVVITIPEQKDYTKPFLITKTLDGKKQVEIVFGYAQRKGDTVRHLTVIDMQKILRSGLNFEKQLKERLDGIETFLKNAAEQNQVETQKKNDEKRIEKRVELTLKHANLENSRTIIISAYPNQVSQLKTIFLTTDGSIRKHMENPPKIRRGGWSIETLDQAKIIRGEMIRVVNGDRKALDLYRDGTLIFTALADPRFLAWYDEKKQKINPLALIEVIYNFIQFYKMVLNDLEQLPQDFTLRVDFRSLHLEGVKSYLVPYQHNSYAQMFEDEKKEAPDNNGGVKKIFSTENFDVGIIAFEIVKEVYLWFGIEENKIPYTKEESGLKLIDADFIRNIN